MYIIATIWNLLELNFNPNWKYCQLSFCKIKFCKLYNLCHIIVLSLHVDAHPPVKMDAHSRWSHPQYQICNGLKSHPMSLRYLCKLIGDDEMLVYVHMCAFLWGVLFVIIGCFLDKNSLIKFTLSTFEAEKNCTKKNPHLDLINHSNWKHLTLIFFIVKLVSIL